MPVVKLLQCPHWTIPLIKHTDHMDSKNDYVQGGIIGLFNDVQGSGVARGGALGA